MHVVDPPIAEVVFIGEAIVQGEELVKLDASFIEIAVHFITFDVRGRVAFPVYFEDV
jgi:hypothetical protein